MSNTPNIRFKGFTGSWEQRKLSDVAEIIGGGTPSTSKPEYWDGDIDWYSPAEINGQIYVDGSERKITKLGLEKSSARLLPAYRTVLFTSRAGIGKTAILRRSGTTNQGFQSMILKDEINPYFVFSMTDMIKEKAERVASGSTFAEISGKMLGNLEFMFPDKLEQDRIGAYFEAFDTLITLHQCKCNETKELKKYMLQKMFSQNEKKIPEIRFAGFTDDWGQCMLGELVERYEDPVETPHDGYERLGIRSHAKGTFHSYVDAGKELEAAKMHRVAADKFIVNITFAWEHAVAITDDEDAGLLVSHRFPQFSFRKDLKSHFFKYVMIDKKFREHLALSSPGGAGRNRVLKIDDMLKYSIKFPGIAEQIKIGEYFDNIDTLITLHQRKCDELKNIKKFMLQNMFPTKG